MLAPRLPLSFDPLIAEAKRRTRQRRLLLAAIVLLAGALALILALRPWGSSPAELASGGASSHRALSQLRVPLDSDERHWRSLLPPLEGSRADRSAVLARRNEVARMLKTTGVTLVRLRIWRRTTPPAVELVVATNTASAVFADNRLTRFLTLSRPDYLRVVNAHGSMIFVWGGAGNEGFVGSAPALAGCTEGLHGGLGIPPPPCPVK